MILVDSAFSILSCDFLLNSISLKAFRRLYSDSKNAGTILTETIKVTADYNAMIAQIVSDNIGSKNVRATRKIMTKRVSNGAKANMAKLNGSIIEARANPDLRSLPLRKAVWGEYAMEGSVCASCKTQFPETRATIE